MRGVNDGVTSCFQSEAEGVGEERRGGPSGERLKDDGLSIIFIYLFNYLIIYLTKRLHCTVGLGRMILFALCNLICVCYHWECMIR